MIWWIMSPHTEVVVSKRDGVITCSPDLMGKMWMSESTHVEQIVTASRI
jgi:hypothetical protein